jgi:hypothetical protein
MKLGHGKMPFLITRGPPNENEHKGPPSVDKYVQRPAKPSIKARVGAWLSGLSARAATSKIGQGTSQRLGLLGGLFRACRTRLKPKPDLKTRALGRGR